MQAEGLNSWTVAVFYIATGLRPGAPRRLNLLGKFSVGKEYAGVYGKSEFNLFWEANIMKRHTIPLIIVLAGLMVAQIALGQIDRAAGSDRPPGSGRPRYQDMSEAEREKFRADMEERRKRFENMSEEEREKLRAEMRERFGSRPQIMGREQQLEVIASIQEQLNKLKTAIESVDPGARNRSRDLPEDERAKLREKMVAAMRERQMAVTAIEQELAKLKLGGRSPAESRPGISELKAIHGLAVKEKATETAKSIEKLMARYLGQAPGRGRPGEPRPPRERPPRPDRP